MIEIKICSGTACFVMGGSDLLVLEDMLTEDEKKKVNINFVPCLGYCKENRGNPPFVLINGELYDKIDLKSLVEIIRDKIGG